MFFKRKASFIIILIVFLMLNIYIIDYFVGINQRSKIYEDLKQNHYIDNEISVTQTEQLEINTEQIDIPIDFNALTVINKDVYAWLEITNTNIAYPILRHERDDNYYLNNTIENKKGLPGAIYTQNIDAIDFSDFNTIIYGHNMADDSMFGALDKYQDKMFFETHREIIIYTKSQKLVYKVFAAVVYDDKHISYFYDDATHEDKNAFIKSLLKAEKGIIYDDVAITTNSKLITLSTCIGDMAQNRYIVCAVLQD